MLQPQLCINYCFIRKFDTNGIQNIQCQISYYVLYTLHGKILEWEKIGEFGESWSLRQYFTRQLEYSS